MFAELSITSNFTFLTGASHPEEYMERAAFLGYPAIAIADVNSVAGIVRAHSQAQKIARQVKLRQAADIYGPAAPAQEQFYVFGSHFKYTARIARRAIGAAKRIARDHALPNPSWLGKFMPDIIKGPIAGKKGSLHFGRKGSAGT